MLGYVLSFFWISLFFLLIQRWSFFKLSKIKVIWVHLAFACKILTAAIMLWLYTSYYPDRQNADIFKYFDDGKRIAALFVEQPFEFISIMTGNNEDIHISEYLKSTKYWYGSPSISGINDNRLIISFNAVLSLISMNTIFTHMAFASFLAFIGLMYVFKFFSQVSARNNSFVFAATFFTPSVLFWTSGILKEAFMIFGIGGLLYHSLSVEKRSTLLKVLASLFFMLVLFLSKMYIAFLLIPLILAYRWNAHAFDGKGLIRYLMINLFFLALLLNLSSFTSIDPAAILSKKQYEFKCLAEWMNAGSMIHIPDLDGSWYSFLVAAPYALFNTLFRPHILDSLNSLGFLAFLEIIALIGLNALALVFPVKRNGSVQNFMFFALNFSFLLALLIGWTTPVLGAIVRYRIPIVLFMIVLPLFFLDLEKIRIFTRSTNSTDENI